MVNWRRILISPVCIAGVALFAATLASSQETGPRSQEQAIRDALVLIQRAAENYPNHRKCFSCHHQTLPMFALSLVGDRGLPIDDEIIPGQAEFTRDSFHKHIKSMHRGTGIGGSSMTVGYGLWALDVAEHSADETTAAMVEYLLQRQNDDGHWPCATGRPPLEHSQQMCTTLAAYYLERFATADQRDRAAEAKRLASNWLSATEPQTQEDRNSRLWGLVLLGGDSELIVSARKDVLAEQNTDGGWGQTNQMESDAYATGQSLYVLHASGVSTSEKDFRRGIQFLLETQLEDGSWLVETRGRPVQEFFDNGDPHGKHQFISTAATCWAVAALAVGMDR